MAHARWLARNGSLQDALDLAGSARDATKTIMGVFGLHIMENQITALERTIAEKPVHRALRRYLGDDDRHLTKRTCPADYAGLL